MCVCMCYAVFGGFAFGFGGWLVDGFSFFFRFFKKKPKKKSYAEEFLHTIGLDQYSEKMNTAHFDTRESFQFLDDTGLQEIGIANASHREKILSHSQNQVFDAFNPPSTQVRRREEKRRESWWRGTSLHIFSGSWLTFII